jgi:DNA mismatch repair protein PMS2
MLHRPKSLDLTAPQEAILLEHIDVFEKNGFEFIVNDNNPPGRRVALKTIPHSKNTVFGIEGTFVICRLIHARIV